MTLGDFAARAGAWLWPILVWISTGFLVVLLRSKTPAQWIALGEKNPRAQGAIRLLRGLGLDPAKVLDGAVQLLTGRVRPLAAERLSPDQRRMLERARTALIAVSVAERSDEDREALARLDELLGGAAPQLSTDPRSEVRGELHEAPGVPRGEQANDDGTPPAKHGGAGGFAQLFVLRAIACAVLALAFWFSGCSSQQPDGCPVRATRCSPRGIPQSCTLGKYWSSPRPETPCAAGAVCCYAMSPYGRALHTCVPQGACLPEPSPPVDAGTEGGAL